VTEGSEKGNAFVEEVLNAHGRGGRVKSVFFVCRQREEGKNIFRKNLRMGHL